MNISRRGLIGASIGIISIPAVSSAGLPGHVAPDRDATQKFDACAIEKFCVDSREEFDFGPYKIEWKSVAWFASRADGLPIEILVGGPECYTAYASIGPSKYGNLIGILARKIDDPMVANNLRDECGHISVGRPIISRTTARFAMLELLNSIEQRKKYNRRKGNRR